MNRKIGFTLIELLITITIMVVLLTLTVVSLRSSQATARDEERKTDVAIIAQQLEDYYKSGSAEASLHSPIATLASTSSHAKLAVGGGSDYAPGKYPSTAHMANTTEIKTTLRDLDVAVLRAPGVADSAPISLVVAANTAEPTPNTSTYVYQPLKADGTLCTYFTDDCRRFNLFYKLETNSTVQKITSKHQ